MKNLRDTTFREWLARTPEDLFGIDPEHNLTAEEKRKKRAENYDNPGGTLSPTILMSELVRMGPIGNKAAQRVWSDVVSFGDRERPGSLMATMTPTGSLRINVRKLAIDLEGTKVWCLKKVISLIEQYDQKERGDIAEKGLAQQYHEEISKIDSPDLESPKNDYKNTELLALKVASISRRQHPTVMHYVGIRKHSEQYYQIYFQYRGHGQGGDVPRQGVMEQFDIHIKYYQERGVLRSWANEIQSPKRGHRWTLAPSFWDEYFMPTQPIDEICNAIIQSFITY